MLRVRVSAQTITNGNVSEAEAMMAQVAASQQLVRRLQVGGLAVVHVMLVSCEPLDPSELPVRLRPQIINFTLPVQGKLPATASVDLKHAIIQGYSRGQDHPCRCFRLNVFEILRTSSANFTDILLWIICS